MDEIMESIISLIGIIALLSVAYLLSENKRQLI